MKIFHFTDLAFIPASHEDPNNPGVLKKVLARRSDLAEGNIQMINWAMLPTGKSFSPHYHEDMEEVFIILSGEVEITIDGESDKLFKGDLVIIPSRAVHQMKNISTTNVEYIAMGISKAGKGNTVNV